MVFKAVHGLGTKRSRKEVSPRKIECSTASKIQCWIQTLRWGGGRRSPKKCFKPLGGLLISLWGGGGEWFFKGEANQFFTATLLSRMPR